MDENETVRGGSAMTPELLPWVTPRLIPLAGTADSRNNISGVGDVDSTYSGFPYGYS
jgi:hypothetical protein